MAKEMSQFKSKSKRMEGPKWINNTRKQGTGSKRDTTRSRSTGVRHSTKTRSQSQTRSPPKGRKSSRNTSKNSSRKQTTNISGKATNKCSRNTTNKGSRNATMKRSRNSSTKTSRIAKSSRSPNISSKRSSKSRSRESEDLFNVKPRSSPSYKNETDGITSWGQEARPTRSNMQKTYTTVKRWIKQREDAKAKAKQEEELRKNCAGKVVDGKWCWNH